MNYISTVISKKMSFTMKSSPRLVHIYITNDNGNFSSTVHCGLDVAKFSFISTSNVKEFDKHLKKNGFDTNNFAVSSITEIMIQYNIIADTFRG